MPDIITTLAKYELIGVIIALIALVSFIIKKVFCLMNTHINSNTEATKNLTVMVHELKTLLKVRYKQ